MLIKSTEKLLNKAGQLYEQMKALKIAGDDFIDYFTIDATINVNIINENTIQSFNIDENNGESNYIAMSSSVRN